MREIKLPHLIQFIAVSIICVASREWMKLGGKAFFCFIVCGFLWQKGQKVNGSRSQHCKRSKETRLWIFANFF